MLSLKESGAVTRTVHSLLKHVDVVVAGAGFAGLACAKRLAQSGLEVVVLERKKVPGTGMHTTGILVKEAANDLDLPPALLRRIAGVRLYSPSLRTLSLETPDYFFMTTDTPGLMVHFSELARNSGAQLRYGEPYTSAIQQDDLITLPDRELSCRWLIGADGPRSKVAADFGLGRNEQFLLGVEAEFKNFNIPGADAFHCFLDRRLAPGYIGWVIPGVGITQVGLATRFPMRPDIDAFVNRIAPIFDMSSARIAGRRGGLIPVGGLVKPFAAGNVILLGDAAGTVSPLTAGGIHTALHYGEMLADLIVSRDTENGPHPARVLKKRYPRFRTKRAMRWTFENLAPEWAMDALIGSRPFAALARTVFFRSKRLPGQG